MAGIPMGGKGRKMTGGSGMKGLYPAAIDEGMNVPEPMKMMKEGTTGLSTMKGGSRRVKRRTGKARRSKMRSSCAGGGKRRGSKRRGSIKRRKTHKRKY